MLQSILQYMGMSRDESQETILPIDSDHSSIRSLPISDVQKPITNSIYNPVPYSLDSVKIKQPSSNSFAYKLLTRLAGLWFVTVAAGSVICSIPISAMGLPIILGIGITCLLILSILQYIIHLYIQFLKFCWTLFKSLVMSPTQLISLGVSIVRKMTHYFMYRNTGGLVDSSSYPELPPLNRRLSVTSRNTDTSVEDYGRWRYYDPLQRPFISNPNQTEDHEHRRPFISNHTEDQACDRSMEFETRPTLNPQFMWLDTQHQERLDYCRQLYSSTTSLPLDQFELLVGVQEDGSNQSILSLWNEPESDTPLDYHHLIGFCQVLFADDSITYCPKNHTWYISINSTFLQSIQRMVLGIDLGFSRRLIRKLMYSPNVHGIQVWSVWNAELFYKGMGFKNVFEASDGSGKRRRVEGEWGPLLMWTSDRHRTNESLQTLRSVESHSNLKRDTIRSVEHLPKDTLRSVESLPNLKTRELRTKESMVSLLGSGAYQNKIDL